MENAVSHEAIEGIICTIGDIERLISRVCLERANPRDMVSLAESLECSQSLREALSGFKSDILVECAEEIGDLRDIAGNIADSIVDDGNPNPQVVRKMRVLIWIASKFCFFPVTIISQAFSASSGMFS